jgi:DNA-binding LacI/PurR family transcriptional regulator
LRHRDPRDANPDREFLYHGRTDPVVCANDRTAALLRQALRELGREARRDVRLVGIDNVEYVALLPTPLTTLRQPTAQIGAAALVVMLDQAAGSDGATRDVLLQGTLVVRKSCGSPHPLAWDTTVP